MFTRLMALAIAGQGLVKICSRINYRRGKRVICAVRSGGRRPGGLVIKEE